MKISWLADFTNKNRGGGAQMTDRYLIDYGKKIGHKIDELGLFNVSNLQDVNDYIRQYDVLIISNFYELSKIAIIKELINTALQRVKVIRFSHDYDGYYTFKNNIDYVKYVIKHCEQLICLSPLHLKTYNQMYGTAKKQIIVPPFIDINRFYEIKTKYKIYKSVTFGEIAKHKGTDNLLRYEAKNHIDFYSHNIEQELNLGHITFKPAIPNTLVNILLNKYDEFVFFPEWNEPFGRMVAEAYLSGINMNVDKTKIGFYSFDWNYNDKEEIKEHLTNSMQLFYENI